MIKGSFFVSHYYPHYEGSGDISSNTALVANIGETKQTNSLPKMISAPEEGRSWNDSPMDSPKKSRIKLDQVAAEIEEVNFQHMISTVENLARFFKISTTAEGLERLITIT